MWLTCWLLFRLAWTGLDWNLALAGIFTTAKGLFTCDSAVPELGPENAPNAAFENAPNREFCEDRMSSSSGWKFGTLFAETRIDVRPEKLNMELVFTFLAMK